MLTPPPSIPEHRPYPLTPGVARALESHQGVVLDALIRRDGAQLTGLFEDLDLQGAGEGGRLLGEAILRGPGPSPELLAPWLLSPFEGLFQGTLAALGHRGRTQDPQRLLDWMTQLEGPFEAMTPQASLMGVLGLCAFADASEEPLPEGIWQGGVMRLMAATAWDPRRPEAIRALGILGGDQGPCGRWIQETLRGGLLRELEGMRTLNTVTQKAVALMGAALPGSEPYGRGSFEGLRLQMPSEEAWCGLLIQGQSIGRSPCEWLPEVLGDDPGGLRGRWRRLWLISRTSAAPGAAPIKALEGALERGEGEILLACGALMGEATEGLHPALTKILMTESHPMGQVAMALFALTSGPPEGVRNIWARLDLGDAGALPLALEALGGALATGEAPQRMAGDIGGAAAKHPALAALLIEAATQGTEPAPGTVMALDALAQALWQERLGPAQVEDGPRALGSRLKDLALQRIGTPGPQALQWGSILGWTGEGDPAALGALLALIARTPAEERPRLLAPLGCLGDTSDDTLAILLGAITPRGASGMAEALQGLANLSRGLEVNGGLDLPWQSIHGHISRLWPEPSVTLEPLLSRTLWTLSQV